MRLTGLLLLQHLERRIGQQEERIRRLELLHQRDVSCLYTSARSITRRLRLYCVWHRPEPCLCPQASQGTGDIATTEDSLSGGGPTSGISHFVLPLTFSPFLSKKMGEYIDASSISLEGISASLPEWMTTAWAPLLQSGHQLPPNCVSFSPCVTRSLRQIYAQPALLPAAHGRA